MSRPLSPSQTLLLCGVLALLLLVLDLHTPLGVADGVLYVSVVLVALALPDSRAGLFASAGCTVLILIGFWLSPPGDVYFATINRLLAVMVLWLAAFLGVKRIKAEANERAAEDRFRSQYEGNPVPTYTWRYDGCSFTLIDYNRASEALTKGRIKEWVGRRFEEMFTHHPDLHADLLRCASEGRTVRREMTHTMVSTAEVKELDVTYVFIPPDVVMVHTQDMTDRKQAERDLLRTKQLLEGLVEERGVSLAEAKAFLREERAQRRAIEEALHLSEERFLRVFEQASVGLCLVDAHTNLVKVNRAFCDLVGYPEDELIGRGYAVFTHPDDLEANLRLTREFAGGDRAGYSLDKRYIRKDGTIVWAHVAVTSIRFPGAEQPLGLAAVIDITARKAAEAELHERNKILDMVHRVSGIVQEATSIEEACRVIAEEVSRATGFKIVAVELYDPQLQRLSFKGAVGIPDAMMTALSDVPADDTLSGIVVRTGRPLLEMRASQRSEYRHPELRRLGVDTFLCVPLIASGSTIGALSLASAERKAVPPDLLPWIGGVAAQIATVIARLTAQLRLRDSEEKFQQLVNSVNEVFWIVDAVTGRADYISPAYERIWGRPCASAAAAYRDIFESVHHDDRQAFQAAMEAHRKGEDTTIEYRMLRPDGRIRWIRCQAICVKDGGGALARIVGVASDITERKQAEEALRRSEERVRSIITVLAEGVVVQDREGIILSCNPSAERILGLSAEQIVGTTSVDRPWQTIREDGTPLPGEEHPAMRTLRTGEPCENVVMGISRADGEVAWISVNAKPLMRKQDRQPYGVVSSFVDITARKQAEAALLRRDRVLEAVSFAAKQFLLSPWSGERLSEVLHRLGEAAEVDHICVFKNEGDAEELKTSLFAEWVASGITSRLDDRQLQGLSYRQRGLDRWTAILSTGVPIAGAVREWPAAERAVMSVRGQHVAALVPIFVGERWWGFMVFGLIRRERAWQGSEVEALQVAASTFGAGLQCREMEVQIKAYTENLEQLVEQRTTRVKELEAQRAQADKLAAVGQLAAGVAHEINNPIAGIKNAFLVLKEGIPSDYPYYQFVGMIEREIERVIKIVRHMYDLYRTESTRGNDVVLPTLLQDILYLVNPKLVQKGIRLETDLAIPSADLCRVPRDLSQVLLNLIQNAIDVSPADRVIRLEVGVEQGVARIKVIDQGPGIEPDVLPHIFEPFYSRKKTDTEPGMGLGLSVCHSLVQAMGGHIDVTTAVGQGTTFTVHVPFSMQDRQTTDQGGSL